MKIAVLSDIHGNLPALRRVIADIEQWGPDLVVVNGDIVNRGPSNLACWQLIKAKEAAEGWHLLRGNHEDYVLMSANPSTPTAGPEAELRRFSDWTYRQLYPHRFELARLPDRWSWTAPDGSIMLVTHGTFLGNRIGIYPDTSDEDLRERIAPAPDVFVTGHTHRPLTRQIDEALVVNIGSAGLPFDGEWRVSYGRFTWGNGNGWQVEVPRLAYDRSQAEKDLFTSGFIAEAGPFARLVLVELRVAYGLIHRWTHQYHEAFLNQEISLGEAVDRFLSENDLTRFLTPPSDV